MHMKSFLLVCCGLLSACVCAREVDTVLVVSIDALHPAALSDQASPNLHRLMHSGRYTLQGHSVMPPQTLIAHTAMMTGLTPSQNGKQDNEWKPGMAHVAQETLLDFAKQRGYQTAYFYAKPKLGYLVSPSVDEHALARDDGVDRARAFFRCQDRRFVFLHISGLEDAGRDSGWLSPDYVGELTHIDKTLGSLMEAVRQRGSYLIVVTSDHAGHGREHGTNHPEDFKLPVIVAASRVLQPLAPGVFNIIGLKTLVQSMVILPD
jgi:predicted AlkP superfamily pyrophosphatase or phosphodiesterase